VLISEWNTVRDGRLGSVVFNTAAFRKLVPDAGAASSQPTEFQNRHSYDARRRCFIARLNAKAVGGPLLPGLCKPAIALTGSATRLLRNDLGGPVRRRPHFRSVAKPAAQPGTTASGYERKAEGASSVGLVMC
jgi:hypothetical protein